MNKRGLSPTGNKKHQQSFVASKHVPEANGIEFVEYKEVQEDSQVDIESEIQKRLSYISKRESEI